MDTQKRQDQLEGPQEDGADKDAKTMLKCKNWRSAEDRDAWKQRIEEPKAPVEL
jgi:hypothetical protein